MKSAKAVIVFAVIFIIAAFAINSISVFSTYSGSADYIYNIRSGELNPELTDIYILKYNYTTGAGWVVERSTNKKLENQYVCIASVCNPRDLKENKDFSLDYMARYVVVADKDNGHIGVDNEELEVICPREIIITDYYNDGTDKIRFNDLSGYGKLRSIAAVVIPSLRIHK